MYILNGFSTKNKIGQTGKTNLFKLVTLSTPRVTMVMPFLLAWNSMDFQPLVTVLECKSNFPIHRTVIEQVLVGCSTKTNTPIPQLATFGTTKNKK